MQLNLRSPRFPAPDVRSVVTCLLLSLGLLLYRAQAQTPVVLSPLPQLQFFDQSGNPLAFGCVFAYSSGTVSPLDTYTDYTGGTKNQNPVILSGGGSANIWLIAGLSYSLRVKSSGGANCSSGSTLYTVSGIGGGTTTLTTVVPYASVVSFTDAAQNMLFELTLTGNATSNPMSAVGVVPPGYVTFEITQDGSGGHTFAWPSNVIGGCAIDPAANSTTQQMFVWNGSEAIAVGPCTTGNGPNIAFGNAVGNNLLLNQTLTVTGLSLLNGGFGCVEGAVVSGVAGQDLMWCDSVTHRFNMDNDNGGQDQVVGALTIDTFENKNFNAAVNGNVFEINSQTLSSVTGTGSAAVASGDPTLAGFNCAITSITNSSSPYTLLSSTCTIQVSANSGAVTIVIPHATVGNYWTITRTDTAAHAVTIEGDSGNVNGQASITQAGNSTFVCHADGTNAWCSVASGTPLLTQTFLNQACTSSCTFTFPIAYSAAPACSCIAVNQSCTLTGTPSGSAATFTTASNGNIWASCVGAP